MPYYRKKNGLVIGGCLLLLLFAGVMHHFDRGPLWYIFLRNYLTFGILYSLVIIWMISVRKRMIPGKIANYFSWMGMMMLLLLFLRQMRYWYTAGNTLSQMLWYMYYIPMILIPLFGLFAIVMVGRSERFRRRFFWLYGLAAILILMVLTNNLHELVFSEILTVAGPTDLYEHEIVYYLIFAWIIILYLLMIRILFGKCQSIIMRRYFWIPVAALILGGLLFLQVPFHFLEMPECYCAMSIFFFESCMEIGLFPVNLDYDKRFMYSKVPAKICNDQGDVIYHTKRDMIQGIHDDRTYVERAYDIRGGKIFWTEDVTSVHEIKKRLAEQQKELSAETMLIRSSNEVRERDVRARVSNELYRDVALEVKDRVLRAMEILDHLPEDNASAREQIALCAVYTAHIKRQSNLMLLTKEHALLSVHELALCLMESVDYLKELQVTADCAVSGSGEMDSQKMLTFYDFYEQAIEKSLPGLKGCMVFLRSRNDVHQLQLVLQNPSDAIFERDWLQAYDSICYDITQMMEDDTLYLTISERKEVIG